MSKPREYKQKETKPRDPKGRFIKSTSQIPSKLPNFSLANNSIRYGIITYPFDLNAFQTLLWSLLIHPLLHLNLSLCAFTFPLHFKLEYFTIK